MSETKANRHEDDRHALLARVDVTPASLEFRALLEDERTVVDLYGDDGATADNAALDLAAIWGAPSAELLSAFLSRAKLGRPVLALAPLALTSTTSARLGMRKHAVMTLTGDARLATPPQVSTRVMQASDLLRIEDRMVGAEIAAVFGALRAVHRRAGRDIWVALDDENGRPVAFAFSRFSTSSRDRTSSDFSLSADTVTSHRRRGYATAACAAVIAAERAQTSNACVVWTVDLDNAGSIALATSLGFVATGTFLWVGAVGLTRGSDHPRSGTMLR